MPKLFNLLSSDVEEYVLQFIETHGLKAGDRLPTERSLAEELGITRSSLRSGLQALIDQGVIYSKQGSGSYLCHPKAVRSLAKYCFPFADENLANKRYEAMPVGSLPSDLDWLEDYLMASNDRDVAQLDLFLESIDNCLVALTANAQSAQSCALFPNLFKLNNVPAGIVQTQEVRVFDKPSSSVSKLLRTREPETLLLLQNRLLLGDRQIALSYSICVGTRVDLISRTGLPRRPN
ncbi:GntR family transcriptional regulator [Collinsella tanakaei]|uniref:GntR family transcriptional regulator n=1 Tax=Collinsella tanakaei TaxID=626935 RepID=UPI0022DE9D23|nr:GntR family transcriptional regulator [Collinsella tanakaei]